MKIKCPRFEKSLVGRVCFIGLLWGACLSVPVHAAPATGVSGLKAGDSEGLLDLLPSAHEAARLKLLDPTRYQPMLQAPDVVQRATVTGQPEIVTADRLGHEVLKEALAGINERTPQALEQAAKRVLAEYPGSGLGYEVLGTAKMLAGDADAAAAAFRKASELEPGQSGPLSKLGTLLMMGEQYDEARKILQQAVSVNPDDRFSHQKLAMLYDRENDAAKAIFHYAQGLKNTPLSYVGVAERLAALLIEQREYALAVAVLEPRLPLESDNALAQHILASALLGSGQGEKALARFRRAAELDVNLVEARLGAIRVLQQQNAWNDASRELDSLLQANPGYAAAWLENGRVLLQLQMDQQAERSLEKAQELGVDANVIADVRSRHHLARGERDKAVRVFRQLVDNGSASASTFAKLSEVYLAGGDLAASESALQQGLAAYPQSAYLHFRKGSLLAATRRYPEAISSYQQSLDLSPSNRRTLQALSLAQARAGLPGDALKTATALLQLAPNDPDVRFFHALRLQGAGDNDKALEAYLGLARDVADNPLIHNNLAALLLRAGNLESAEKHALVARNLAPKAPHVLDTLGMVYLQKRQFDEAAEVLEMAHGLARDVPHIAYHYALALEGAGRLDDAAKIARVALSLAPGAPWAENAKRIASGS